MGLNQHALVFLIFRKRPDLSQSKRYNICMLKLLIGSDLLLLVAFIWRFPHLPEQIPLFYSLPWGEAQIADVWYILLLPIFMNLMYFGNGQIAKRFFASEEVFQHLFRVVNLVIIVGFTGIFLKILLLVT